MQMSPFESPVVQKTLAIALILFCLGGVVSARQDLALFELGRPHKGQHLYYLPPAKTLRRLSLGFTTTAADLIWIRALLYVGSHFNKERGDIAWVGKYAQTITTLDPKFKYAYRWGAALLLYNRHKTNRTHTKKSIAILKKGYKHFPESFEFARALGMSYLFEIKLLPRTGPELLQDHQEFCKQPAPKGLKRIELIKKIKRCLRKIAANYIMEAAAKKDAPNHLAILAARIMRKEGSKQSAICDHLLDVLWKAPNKKMRQHIRSRLNMYCGRKELGGFICEEKQFHTRWYRSFPYLTPSLYTLIDIPQSSTKKTPFTLETYLKNSQSPCRK
ncbi:MAG TPA: hypothetical protein DCE42_19810 [Myxococcales bacterium]|nr:hypothetical protein [Deltaproteobacteria bacterium]MBU54499.1 hypothetical protein [Deltaproteobacteria bacterium]HAA57022.1 hypothetical protein [Myxococcales bacterium]|tara:strand:- start:12946 stop:13938 length:993 start_codon:yes stop_codon:yes gene_type:complete